MQEETRGRKPKYLTIKEWDKFINNHWKHMTWKVNLLVAGACVMVSIVLAIFGILLSHVAV